MRNKMEYKLKEKFKLNDNGSMFDLPISIRERIHKEVSEILTDIDDDISKAGSPVGVEVEEWPARYLFDEDGQVVVVIPVLKPDMKEIAKVLTFNFHRDEIDKLIKD